MSNIKPQDLLYVGVDVHKDSHAACLTNCFGQTLLKQEIGNEKKDFVELVKQVKQVSGNRGLKPIFGLEDSYGYGLRLATFLVKENFSVKTVCPVLVDRRRKYETHPEKNDFLDALGVAKVLIQRIDSLPNYTIALQEEIAQDLKGLVNDRDFIVKEQTRLKNQVHRLLHRSYGSSYRKLFKSIASLKALKYWHRHPLPVKKLDDNILINSNILKARIRRKIRRLIEIREELKELKQEIELLVRETGQHLETMSGCGPVLAARVIAETRDINRFKSADCFAKYAGLCPREKSSGKTKRHIKTKSGNRKLNMAIHRIALSQIGAYGNQHAKEYFQRKVQEGKSKLHALCCLKRRLADIIYLMLKNEAVYNYHKATLLT